MVKKFGPYSIILNLINTFFFCFFLIIMLLINLPSNVDALNLNRYSDKVNLQCFELQKRNNYAGR